LTKLDTEVYGTSFIVKGNELDMGATASSLEELNGPVARPKVRIDKLLRDAAAAPVVESNPKQVRLRFLLNPVQFKASEADPTKLGAVVCERTKLEGEPGKQVADGTGEFETITAQLVSL
jgi:adrenodoxin-NADP+ reductase